MRGLWRSKGDQRRTGTPARCSSRATTRPSPPLWPGPTSTRAAAGGVASSRRAIARAAFSIRASTGSPLANNWLSSAAIWAPVTNRWSASARGQAGQGGAATGSGRGASRCMGIAVLGAWAQTELWTDLPASSWEGTGPGTWSAAGTGADRGCPIRSLSLAPGAGTGPMSGIALGLGSHGSRNPAGGWVAGRGGLEPGCFADLALL